MRTDFLTHSHFCDLALLRVSLSLDHDGQPVRLELRRFARTAGMAKQAQADASAVKMDAAVLRRLQPQAFLEHFLDDGVRPDGRNISEAERRRVETGPRLIVDPSRSSRLTTGRSGVIKSAFGSALASIGTTSVVCAVTAQVATPDPASPLAGFLGKGALALRMDIC